MSHVEYRQGPYWITTDPAQIDLDAVHAYLTESYWARGIPRELVARSIQNSMAFGLFDGDRQIGLARVITDRTTFAYLCDVYVLDEYRGRGLARWLMKSLMAHPDLQGLRRFVLVTRSAAGLYEKFGFKGLSDPDAFMEIVRPDIYTSTSKRS
jgi:ribosomal protein S18 acetylase RimI-like enzyme